MARRRKSRQRAFVPQRLATGALAPISSSALERQTTIMSAKGRLNQQLQKFTIENTVFIEVSWISSAFSVALW